MAKRDSTTTDDGNVKLFGVEDGHDKRENGNSGKSNEGSGDTGQDTGNGDGNGSEYINPVNVAGDEYERDDDGNVVYGTSGKPRKKRGRKPGGKTGRRSQPKSAGNNQAINSLTQALILVHMGLAGVTKFPDFALDPKTEAEPLANSISNVLAEFDVEPNPKFTAMVGLISTASVIYGPRIYLYKQQKEEQKKEKKKEQSQDNNVIDMTPFNLGG